MNYFTMETIHKIRQGYFSALYFNRTKVIFLKENNVNPVTMQIFQKNKASILCGVNEVLELLKIGTGYWEGNRWVDKFEMLKINHLEEGMRIDSWESVMHITGPYVYFAHLESLYLGILARRTLVATNSRRVIEAAGKKQVVFFADRFDHFLNQEGDGYAAHVGGIQAVCTEAQAAWWKGRVTGTIPHAFIAVNNGDTVEAARQFAKHIKDRVIALVDFDNDCVATSLRVSSALGRKLWGVRVDTAENIKDRSLMKKRGQKYQGVNPTLIKLLRKKLDERGFSYIKIFVSGGFDEEKIRQFEKAKTPVDGYGVGSSLLKGNNDFTADIVMVERKKIAKHGRRYREVRSHSHK